MDDVIRVRAATRERRSEGSLTFGGRAFRCALGRSGIARRKTEGDGATPSGNFPIRRILYRADRVAPPETRLPIAAIARDDGWCDDPRDKNYNRQVRLPYPSHHENLWREDALYDLVVVIGHNDDPVRTGEGSAVFLHIARLDFAPTEGCVALASDDFTKILGTISPTTRIEIVTD